MDKECKDFQIYSRLYLDDNRDDMSSFECVGNDMKMAAVTNSIPYPRQVSLVRVVAYSFNSVVLNRGAAAPWGAAKVSKGCRGIIVRKNNNK